MIQWVEGRKAKTPEEKSLCLKQAEQLLNVPRDSYDLWSGNFLISDQIDTETGEPKVFYIDRDIPETIAEKGYSPEIPEQRIQAFTAGKEKMI